MTRGIAVGDRMFWEVQDFDFAQICSLLPKSNQFCQTNFAREMRMYPKLLQRWYVASYYGCIDVQ